MYPKMKTSFAMVAVYLSFLGGLHSSDEAPKYGKVKPLPNGFIYMAFIDPQDDQYCRRSQDGQITSIITPTKREADIVLKYNPEEFGQQVKRFATKDPGLSRSLGIAGPDAWEYVKQFLLPTDGVWIYNSLDTGFVVIRNNKIFCLVVTSHAL
jgi:hypothetical protein